MSGACSPTATQARTILAQPTLLEQPNEKSRLPLQAEAVIEADQCDGNAIIQQHRFLCHADGSDCAEGCDRAADPVRLEAIVAAVKVAKYYETPPAWMWGRADSVELLAAWSAERARLLIRE